MARKPESSPPRPALSEVADLREVLFEFSAVGNSVRVSAVDPVTLAEATIIGPLSAGEHTLKMAALQKLRYVIDKQRADSRSQSGRTA